MADGRMILTSPLMLLSVAIFFISVAAESAEDIVGCGGFLKTRVPIDFSQVLIKLYTKQGIVKELSDCAPTNGYYFIPIYDKGEYSLKLEAPKGWYFEPEVVQLNFDGVSDPCSKANDINFTFKGFAVNGKATSKGSKDGPDNVLIALTTEKNEMIRTTKTKESGLFEFKAVEPGNYIVKIEDERYTLSKGALKIAVKSGNVDIPPDSLIIAGYDLTGEVLFEGEPIKGVNIVLYGNDEKTRKYIIPGCSNSPLPEIKRKDFLCHVTSDEKGTFKISPIPPGLYSVRPHYVKFDVQPQVINVEIKHGHLNLAEKFMVKGFSVSGKILSLNGKGIDKVEIYLNGELVTKTDAEGKYNLDSMEPGNYLLQVRSDALKFTDLNLKLTPNKPEIDTIYPYEFRVCGRVTLSGQTTRFVEIKDKKRGHVVEAAANRETGVFCQFLKSGIYTVNVKISDFEKSKGLQYLPTSREIIVASGPINDVDFSQLRGKVTGKIVKLSPSESAKGGRLAIKLKSQNSVIAMKTLERNEATYAFIDVMPGDYDIEIQSDNWCFKNLVYPVSVTSSETYVPDFVQSGFKTRIVSSHATKAYWRESQSPKSKNEEIDLAKGENMICLPSSTTYEFEPFGCHGYDKVSYNFNPVKEDVLKLTAISHEVSGFVTSSSLANDLFMNVNHSNGQVTRIGPLKGVREDNGFIKYRFSHKFKENQMLRFYPSSENILFQPKVVEYRTRNDCAEDQVQFVGEKGLIVEGRIEPRLSNVKVKLKIFEPNTNATELVQVTKAAGTYKFGPLKNTVRYELTAAKESYVFTGPDKKGVFNAHKLAEINVKVMDNSTKEPLHGVLLSLTGGEKYRKNSMTEEDGSLTFHSLSPGEYFLRPMMKEYKFEPSSQIIQIKEGVTEKIELKGRRVSFSAYGTVSSLNGEPQGNVLIEAIGIDACSNLQEETLTEVSGQFRIKGLLPHCEYYIRLKSDSPVNAHIHKINPRDLIVKTNQGDIRDIKLIAFELVEHTDLSIHVESTIPEHLKTLRLKLCKEETPESPVHVVKLDSLAGGVKHWGSAEVQERFLKAGLLVQLPFVLRDKTPYFIQLDSTLNKHTYTYKEPVVHFIADKTYRNFKIVFDPVPRALDHEFSSSNYIIVPVLVIAALLYKYSNRTVGTIQNIFGMFNQNSFNFSYQDRVPYPETGIHDVTIEPVTVTTKRKTKPRKT